jgi:glycosyltransferase involved in cell wall biosynthesis
MVTNAHLANILKGWGARVFVLKDIPGDYPSGSSYKVDGTRFNVAVVNSFAPDEPLKEILDAARDLPDINFYVTGDTVRAGKNSFVEKPDNVIFTGFLSNIDYYSLLRSIDAVMVLTKHDHTQQRGACEALWLGKPIITSNWPILRDYFSKGAIFVDNTSMGIISSVKQMREQLHEYQCDIQALQKERVQDWEQVREELLKSFRKVEI